ncbi:MAG: hypothetical protein AWU57_539 [Marinobacter sp. T13-3]|nr:MAG: hypothetical protein AWU57_539 [Marinobacter sp. T13-3]
MSNPYRSDADINDRSHTATLVLPVRQSVMMPAANHPLTQMELRADAPAKSGRHRRCVRHIHTLPLAPAWAEVPLSHTLIHQWREIQNLLRHHQWTEVRQKHAIRLGYSPEQWAMLTQAHPSDGMAIAPKPAPTARAERVRGDPMVFMPAITEIVVLADSLTIAASDQRTGVTVESLGFSPMNALDLLQDATPGATLMHPGWKYSDAEQTYDSRFACPVSGDLEPKHL